MLPSNPVVRRARAAQRKQAREIALESSGSDSDESVSEPPSKSARVDDDTGAELLL